MFKCKSCIAKDEEIKYLRALNADLIDRVMALSDQAALWAHKQVNNQVNVPAPSYLDPIGMIQNMAAETEEEKKQKKQAIDDAHRILGN